MSYHPLMRDRKGEQKPKYSLVLSTKKLNNQINYEKSINNINKIFDNAKTDFQQKEKHI